MAKLVYFFGGGKAEGDAKMKELLGGKGANLAEMTNIGLPVPAGFTITTEVCTHYYDNNLQYPADLKAQIEEALAKTEAVMGAKFGDTENPLLVSCRSGARVSMPGMMDTVLNIGLNEATLQGLIKKTGNERFAWDSYRRFVQMFGDVVLGLKPQTKQEIDPFEHIMDELKHERKVENDSDLTVADLKELVVRFKKAVKDRTGKDFPEDAREQLYGAIGSVFDSWNNDRAVVYRRQYGYPASWGTAANICSMVFGNMGDDCATGVAFTRDPATGEKEFYGEYLINAQGEDVVAGIRTPKKIAELKKEMPEVYAQLDQIRGILEKHYRDVQDIEFTVQQGKLWMLQTRNGKRTGFAAVHFAVDMVDEGLITQNEAISVGRIPPDDLNQLLQPIFDPESKRKIIAEGKLLAKGINAGPGAATGVIKFFADDAESYVAGFKADAHGNRSPESRVILVRRETSPEDIRGMQAADGILTAFGGASSHAALVSRQMGKVCVVGCSALQIDYTARTVTVGSTVLKEGDFISIDGFTGEVMAGQAATRPSEVVSVLIDKTMKPSESTTYQKFARMMEWADSVRKLKIRTNADKPEQAEAAVAFGAEGIGLCRTEHMFFDHIVPMREMILAGSVADRKKALEKLLPFQRGDFEGLFRAMKGKPVTIRTLDPPLHEFLPHDAKGQAEMAAQMGVSVEVIEERVKALHEFNPMLGFRGCRLGIVYPEITEMQARAILEAAVNVKKEGIDVEPEIMIPLVGFLPELKSQAKLVHETAKKVFEEAGVTVPYQVGTMIELPRACIAAGDIAKEAQFFSFGTNDLTQTGLGMSRDDYGSFIRSYIEGDIVPKDPFQVIDFDGIGGLMKIGVERGRAQRTDIKIGICGEHGGEPDSVKFCHRIGLNYVSCSPFRVPIARLAAAQAALENK
ncbi:pyruvate, phosphate dikinase [Tuwongella immobilis]|uniref:Pyruvate, phosphate dikinase n=1 Tax=Tuwongella immobilis TaxID=692036 RepID=A0A6C2YS07_9BACT|nr:pyruvate, phosphate dikinase [Tuwongella immobilis]VIP03913.1 pyruvate phosphate dikinase : Pyruvate, phosphate dikinase OS=Planctomyces limnophilus (strain ATCC 43296 / DSM 3776 / IFAM 1008 / 290) GN=Plim_2420 PE=4 SV=1: PPDK_N: PEP-utilizers: PEP-utilizers_C [Tuwongella immobilis]VTS05193.1 pyruvate phosphate dikinase : Pyruvate, phosphate dikinase OS=Planctomyces limnophilus (strain ATCC 43296 / DSM 3776 / IFAM 1008 / 290) GN=Plim_2420 PE=4 SV=1: PPDK_N: PEP-utilizers: PEP-utilizers_C [Tuwo